MVSAQHLILEVLGLTVTQGEKLSVSKHAPLASLAEVILIQCPILRIGMLTGGFLCRERYTCADVTAETRPLLVVRPAKTAPCRSQLTYCSNSNKKKKKKDLGRA